MSTLLTSDITITIISVDVPNNSVIVRPYCSLYKNPPATYPCYNFDYSSLDPSQDITHQLATKCFNIVESQILAESRDRSSIAEFLSQNIEVDLTVAAISAVPQAQQIIYAPAAGAPVGSPLYQYKVSPTTTVITTMSGGVEFTDGYINPIDPSTITPIAGVATDSTKASGINFVV